MSIRTLQQIIPSIATSDGGGVKLRRSLGQTQTLRADPFLMLDEFSSMDADDYIAGFPDHPHRGFETLTYMLDGHMLHQDHLGNQGDLKSGGAQWMTAGRGIIHSEMPQQESGRMRGFQLWVNLPAKEKMKPASYQDVQPDEIPLVNLPNGGHVKIIAGIATIDGQTIAGPIQGISTGVLFLDVRLPGGSHFDLPVNPEHNAFVYPYEGQLAIGPATNRRNLAPQNAGVLSSGDHIEIQTDDQAAAFLLLTGRPIREPIVQYGPFVMNTREEVEQAMADYRNGQLISLPVSG
ncbi:pirin family protein [Methylicorpusculum sp.]|uniref:pirin family protein n=1 Tax=Methylicorpusculum sp. TaxID=2713644 RepID=UPI00272FA742|nr:pirin family protein [Methylicorpusculum sp.]MDP2179745.1 pirin family protein [Methylicorpusculum sp.]MDP3528352.1 pirin family protein [Methylicorpusculum sp.]MDZ4150894.1 pirin family protein [Methylicorpusculum sp.]